MWPLNRISLAWFVSYMACSSPVMLTADEGEVSPIDLFEQRIMPIFNSPAPSSCVQCHLSSVDLKDYILPSHEQTFLSLRDQGLVNLEQPEKSKILQLIGMGDKDADQFARRIHEKMRKAEYEAFSSWIVACCRDPKLRDLSHAAGELTAGPNTPEPVIEFTRKNRLIDSFVRNVWSQRMRCFPCHTPSEIDPDNPKHQKPTKTHADYVQGYGQRMNIFKETPEATLRHLIANSQSKQNRLPLINLADPKQSLLVLKPTAKVPKKMDNGEFESPSHVAPVSHMGGLKMHVNDQSYKSFISWIEDYAKAAGGKYVSVEDLPLDNWYPTNHVLRLKNAPDDWAVLASVQLFVHPWNDQKQAFSEEPLAFTQALVTPRHMLNGSLFVLAPSAANRPKSSDHKQHWNSEGETLAPGRYQVRAYYDSQHLLDDDPVAMLGKRDYVGHVEVEAEWKEGFPNATVIDGAELERNRND